MKLNKPKELPTGEVVVIRPALLRDRDAATYIARSPSWVRAQRAADVRARREGREPTGPTWITISSSVFYKLADLDAWIARNSVERGIVAFSNRGKPASSDGAEAAP